MTPDAVAERAPLYRAVLPHVRADRAVYGFRQPILVSATNIDRPLDVLARLVDPRGRIFAQADATIEPGAAEIGLGTALNLPSGAYEIVVSPPLGQFHDGIDVERRIPVRVVADDYATEPYGDGAGRAAELIQRAAQRRDLTGVLARCITGQPRAADRATMTRCLQGAAAASDVLAVAAVATEILDRDGLAALSAALERLGSATGLVGTAAAALGDRRVDVSKSLRAAGMSGFGSQDRASVLAALTALALRRHGPNADLVEAVLDRLVLECAALSHRGVFADPQGQVRQGRATAGAALSRLLWGVGCFGGADPAVIALARSGYQPPALLQAIAVSAGDRAAVVPAGSGHGASAQFGRNLRIVTQARAWHLGIGPDLVAAGSCERCVASDGALLAAGGRPTLACDAFDEIAVMDNRLGARCGDTLLDLCSDAPIDVVPAPSGAGRELRGDGRLWFLQVLPDVVGETVETVARTPVALESGRSITRTGHSLDLDAAQAPTAALALSDVILRLSDRALNVRHGDFGLILDYS